MITTVQVVWISIQLKEFSHLRQSRPTSRETPKTQPLYVHSQTEVQTISGTVTTFLEQVSRCQIPGTASMDMEHTNTVYIAK